MNLLGVRSELNVKKGEEEEEETDRIDYRIETEKTL